MAQLIWALRAVEDLEEICNFIARDSEQFAGVFAQQVVALTGTISKWPRLGSVVPEYESEKIRERLCHNYRIVYRLGRDTVEIVTICHGARRLPADPPGGPLTD